MDRASSAPINTTPIDVDTADATSDHAGVQGLLIGGLIGDALGGPPEFNTTELVRSRLPATRHWPRDRTITNEDLARLAATLRMYGYERMRPSTAPYGPWVKDGLAGTVTDDSRHKIVLMRAIRAALASDEVLSQQMIAKQLIAFRPHSDRPMQDTSLCEDGLREYRMAARWCLGERDETKALPVERLWGGIANCSGQMMFPPLAAIYAGDPTSAYRATYALDFIDAPAARDICSALNAGLAAALSPDLQSRPAKERWQACFHAIRHTDPLRLAEVPFAGRPLHRWLDLADQLVQRAAGRPQVLFEGLEHDGRPVYWWDAHFTLLVPLTLLMFCRYNALAALHLTLDFGHDTDSYAQVLGCLVGAVEGVTVFPAPMRAQVAARLSTDYGETVKQWESWTLQLRTHHENGEPVCQAIS